MLFWLLPALFRISHITEGNRTTASAVRARWPRVRAVALDCAVCACARARAIDSLDDGWLDREEEGVCAEERKKNILKTDRRVSKGRRTSWTILKLKYEV